MVDFRLGSAALLDRDGTLIEDRDYLRDPADVVLLPGVVDALGVLQRAGYPAILCTNQSGIARGTIALADYRAVRTRLDELLAAAGVSLLDTFTCPHHPDFGLACDCRKPATGLFRRAAATHGLDLTRCIFVGDKARDVLPGLELGGRAALVRAPGTPQADVDCAHAASIPVVASLREAVQFLLPDAR